ncbi:MAG: glycosyltransferase family 2 protein [Caldimonas sp.]
MISVCVPTFNGAPYIGAQLASILASPRVSEVLVSDDGSTDDTLAVVRALRDPRIQMLEGPRRGLIRNVESLLEVARGDQVFLADQDDVWLPEKVDVMLEHLGHVDLVVCDCSVTDATLTVLHPSFFALRDSRAGLLHNLFRNGYLGCCLAFRRELLAHALPFPDRLPMHDWWLGLVAETFGRVAFVPRPLVLYRRHGGNASTTAEASRASWGTRLRWRAVLAAALARRRFERRRSPARVRR